MKKVFYLSSLLAFIFGSVTAFAIPVPVHITSNPSNDTVCSGTTAMFTVAALDTTGGTPVTLAFLWQVSTDGGTTWTTASDTTIYTGTANDTLLVATNVLMNGYKYRCVVSDTNGSAASGSARLAVFGIAPGTISGPSSVCRSSSVTLSDSVSGGTWHSVSPSIATITSGGVLTGVAQGYDTVKYTDSNMCGSGVTWFVIRVDTTPVAMAISGPTATCVGNTITLTNPNVLGTWTWAASNHNDTITHAGALTGLAHGADTIYYVFTNACATVTSSYVVMTDTVLAHGTISGSDSLCAGSWTHLTESISGGSWFSSNSSIATVDASGNVTGVAQGSVTISYYLSNACGASVATHTMHVVRAAAPIAGTDSVGLGLTRLLSDVVAGGTWTTSDTSIATVDSTGLVTGIALGTANITYTVTNFCGTSYSVITMHVGTPPSPATITGPTSVCIGNTITLAASIPGGTWSSGAATIGSVNATTGVVTGVAVDSGTAATIVTITYSYTTGFGTATSTYDVTILHTPIITINGRQVTYTLGLNYMFTGIPGGGTWTHTANDSAAAFLGITDSSAGGVAYGKVLSYIVLRAGTTDVLHYKVTNACGTADSTFVVSIPGNVSVGSVNGNAFALSIYPNPSQGTFTLNMTGTVDEQATVTITNIVGEEVATMTVPTNRLINVTIDQPSGIYIVTAVTSSGRSTARISINK